LGASLALFSLDILMEFNTAYYQHGNLIQKKSLIAIHYLKTNFFFDLITVEFLKYLFSL
jgi:hyperpolarization activated cyclic nucleotide-gated potassium channel 2